MFCRVGNYYCLTILYCENKGVATLKIYLKYMKSLNIPILQIIEFSIYLKIIPSTQVRNVSHSIY